MKKVLCTLLMLMACLARLQAQQQIENGGFENWRTAAFGQLPLGNGWRSLDSILMLFGASSVTVQKVDAALEPANVRGGTYALGLKVDSVTLLGTPIKIGGVLFNGIVDLTDTAYLGGAPYTSRPTALTGYYKIIGNNHEDTAAIQLSFKKQGTEIASAVWETDVVDAGFQSFSLPINWTTTDFPDTLLMTIILGENDLELNMATRFILDDLAFSLPAGIQENLGASKWFKSYPNPATGVLVVENASSRKDIYWKLVDIAGKVMLELPLTDASRREVSIAGIATGQYYYQFFNSKGEVLYGGKVMIAR